MQYQGRSARRRTGGRQRHFQKKKKHQLGREPAETEIGGSRVRVIDSRGNRTKRRALALDTANVAVGGETVTAPIVGVADNPANINYARRNIITKGAIVTVEVDGDERQARVTSRPGQTGQINAVVVED